VGIDGCDVRGSGVCLGSLEALTVALNMAWDDTEVAAKRVADGRRY
jgi:hypothetical protein